MKFQELNKINKSVEGKKTYISAGLLLMFDIINTFYPNLISLEKELIIQKVLSYLIYYGVIDKILRNRKYVFEFFRKYNN